MSEHDEAGDGPAHRPSARAPRRRLRPRLVSGLVMARGRGAVHVLRRDAVRRAGGCRRTAPELGVGPPRARPRRRDLVIAVHVGAAARAAVLAAFGYVGLGLLPLPIGAILATLLSLGRNSVFSALGVFYAGLPAVSLIWLRSDPQLGLRAVIFVIVVVIASDTAGFLAGRLLGGPEAVAARLAQQDLGRPGRRAGWRARSSPPCSGLPFRAARRVRLAATAAVLVLCGAGGRSCRIGHQAPLRGQGCERADPGPRRRDGPRRRAGGGGDGGRAGGLRHQRAFARARAAAGVLSGRGAACRRCAQT